MPRTIEQLDKMLEVLVKYNKYPYYFDDSRGPIGWIVSDQYFASANNSQLGKHGGLHDRKDALPSLYDACELVLRQLCAQAETDRNLKKSLQAVAQTRYEELTAVRRLIDA